MPNSSPEELVLLTVILWHLLVFYFLNLLTVNHWKSLFDNSWTEKFIINTVTKIIGCIIIWKQALFNHDMSRLFGLVFSISWFTSSNFLGENFWLFELWTFWLLEKLKTLYPY